MDIHLINQRLADLHGRDFLGQPMYRVVWSDTQLEKRFSTFRDFLEGTNVLIREVTEVREVKKYAYLDPQWILEKLFFNIHNKEILDNDTLNFAAQTYEPMWAFGYDGKKPKRVVWRAIELIITSVNDPKKLTPSQLSDEEYEQARRDEMLFMDLLNTHVKNDPLHSAIKDGDAVIITRK